MQKHTESNVGTQTETDVDGGHRVSKREKVENGVKKKEVVGSVTSN